jgi:hypothetical protein
MFLRTPGLQAGYELGAEIHAGSEAQAAAIKQAAFSVCEEAVQGSTTTSQHIRRSKMRKPLLVAFGLACLALAGVQPVSAAGRKRVPVNCHVYYGKGGPVRTCDQACTQPIGQGSGPIRPIEQQKLKRQR